MKLRFSVKVSVHNPTKHDNILFKRTWITKIQFRAVFSYFSSLQNKQRASISKIAQASHPILYFRDNLRPYQRSYERVSRKLLLILKQAGARFSKNLVFLFLISKLDTYILQKVVNICF